MTTITLFKIEPLLKKVEIIKRLDNKKKTEKKEEKKEKKG
jgi:hypothetical protein